MAIETSNLLIRSNEILQKDMFENYLYLLSLQILFNLLKCYDPTCIDIRNSCITR